jgi:hypothetical protein
MPLLSVEEQTHGVEYILILLEQLGFMSMGPPQIRILGRHWPWAEILMLMELPILWYLHQALTQTLEGFSFFTANLI